jgi:NADH dehydrogenase/NADH:ubiquinone oxidoreductase subunit G
MNDSEIFEPFERLIEIEIQGKTVCVPENNTLLRCFQYLSMETVSMGDFCWNGDCANCQVWLEGVAKEKPVLACRTKVEEGMKVVRMSEEITLVVSGEYFFCN